MSTRQSEMARPLTLSRLAADVSWGLMVLRQRGATQEALSGIKSGITLCDSLGAAVSGEVQTGDAAVAELQSNLIMSSKGYAAADINVEAAVRSLVNLVSPYKSFLGKFAGAVNIDRADEQINNTRKFFGQLAVTLQELGL